MTVACAPVRAGEGRRGGGEGEGVHARGCVCAHICGTGKLTERCDQIRAEDYFHVSHRGAEC